MPTFDWNIVLTGLLYAALTGVFNLLFAHKSQINAWAEAHPKLAALMKITRAVGLDPQHLWAALALLVKKRLPAVQTEPPAPKSRPGLPSLLMLCFCLVFVVGCGATFANVKPPCDDARLRAIDNAYIAELSSTCLAKYNRAADCPEYRRIKAKHRAALRNECPQ